MRMDERQSDTIYRLVRKDIAKLASKIPYYEAEKPETKDFIKMVQDSVDISLLLHMIFDLLRQIITLIGLATIVLTIHPLFIVLITFVLVLRIISNQGMRILWEKWRKTINVANRKVNYMVSVMNDIGYGKEIRINGLQKWFTDKMSEAIEHYLREMENYNHEIQKKNSIVESVVIIQECIIYVVLAYRVVMDKMLIGDFSMYLSGISSFSNCLSGIIDSISNLLKEGQFLEQYRIMVERERQSKVTHLNSQVINRDKAITICFEHVSFHYPNSQKLILDDINFELKSNQSLSIVGLNGAGKTTIVKLICKLYRPTKGRILLNSIEINEIEDLEYRKILGVVFQDYQLFAFSVLDNVALVPPYDEQKAWKTLQMSGLETKLRSLNRGIHTSMSKELDMFGVEFSGGESQRVELARVLYKEASIIILDEPTASLDPIKEYQLYNTMHEFTLDKCVIFISHRLPSTKFTDYIMVLKDGHIIEYGTFGDLMKDTNGYFYNMYNLQCQHYL
ncbi:ABC transporter ATP-binding protein [Anaerocolumna sp. AGMB13020]|uniref:ABC transporter ATP-binding protein n=1 Tax=Anaerocolumna sp. AGMB13020 TaxID=3081750 RepID=UPI0029546E0B|nr:ABC transporter ATP-binding protein [Anaerocolumna sp. AGMB13020]WOO34866.1 ABC transporter ATP-binding protein [Anaerocolumna sp. AGMB13020]